MLKKYQKYQNYIGGRRLQMLDTCLRENYYSSLNHDSLYFFIIIYLFIHLFIYLSFLIFLILPNAFMSVLKLLIIFF